MDPTPVTIEEAIERFTAEHPELVEAMGVFGIASSEYDRALRALNPSIVYTTSSTTTQS